MTTLISAVAPDGSEKALKCDADGVLGVGLPSVPRTKGSSTISRVASSASSTTLLAANASRTRVIIYNESTADLYVKFGATASATSYTTKLGPGDTYESPTDWVYTGVIDGIWSAANGAAQITEL